MSYATEQLSTDIAKYAESISGSWLNEFNWRGVKIKMLDFAKEGLIQAAYLAVSNSLLCAPDKNDGVFFSSVVHELFHAYQRKKLGLILYLLAKTFSRKTIESPAKQADINAVTWYGFERLEISPNRANGEAIR